MELDTAHLPRWDRFILIVCLLILFGCAGFSYRYFGLSEVSYERGTLLGPQEKDDLPFSHCAPTAENKHPCVVMFAKDFFSFKLDYEDVKMRLAKCEKK